MSIEILVFLENGIRKEDIMPIFEINRFRKARLSAKMTQAQAAEKIGVDMAKYILVLLESQRQKY